MALALFAGPGMASGQGPEQLRSLIDPAPVARSFPAGAAQGLRARSQRDAAMTLGVQGASQWRGRQIRQTLDRQARELDRTFAFARLTLNGGRVLPPVIVESRGAYKQASDDRAVTTQAVYRIVRPPRIIAVPPTWRDYLIRDYPAAGLESVNPVLLPKDAAERAAWAAAVREGWAIGIRQGDRNFESDMARLERDFLGMLAFKELALQKIVSLPFYSEDRLGIRVHGDDLEIGTRVLHVQPARFNEAKAWKPIIGSPANP